MRASLGLRWWDEFWANLSYALRILRKSPGFPAVAVVSLSLGIGVNTAIFTFTILLRPLPVPDPGRLLSIYQRELRRLAEALLSRCNAVVRASTGCGKTVAVTGLPIAFSVPLRELRIARGYNL